MKNKTFIYILFLTLGFFLIPNVNYACGSNSKNKTSIEEVEKKSCCEKGNDSENGCKGECEHSKCNCSLSSSSNPSFAFLSYKLNPFIFNFSTQDKVNFSYNSPSLSDGFTSIWAIPKIS